MRRIFDRVAILIAQGIFVGRSPVVPGTAGTLATIPLYWAMAAWLSLPAYLLVTLMVTLIGIWSAHVTERVTGQEDPRIVIIDEVAGFLVTMAGHPFGWKRILGGFLLFRIFDIIKPPPLRRLERFGGGLGIVADDIGAGIYANLSLLLAVRLYHLVFPG